MSVDQLFPVLSKFAGMTWDGDCREVNGDLRFASNARKEGGLRYEIFEDGLVSLMTYMRSANGRMQAIDMRGRRVDGPGSSIRLDMEQGPNTMIITELAPDTLLMNEVNRETGHIIYTASLFLANNDELVQVSHSVGGIRNSGGRGMMPVDLHQVWRLGPSRAEYDRKNYFWRDADDYVDDRRRNDRPMEQGGGGPRGPEPMRDARAPPSTSWSDQDGPRGRDRLSKDELWPRFDSRSNTGRRSNNGRSDEPRSGVRTPPRRDRGGSGRYNDMDEELWLLDRSPEDLRDSFREKFDRLDPNSREGLALAYGDRRDRDYRREELILDPELRARFPVLSKIAGIDWDGTCRYIIGDTKPDSILLLNGGMRYDIDIDGVCTMTTTLAFGDGKTREVTMRGIQEPDDGNSMRLYPVDDNGENVYTVLTEQSPDTILLNEIDRETGKVIYTASLSISSDLNELVQVTHELGDGLRMPVEGHQVWRLERFGADNRKRRIKDGKNKGPWVAGTSSSLEEMFPVLSKIEGAGWQGNFRFIPGDLERTSYKFEATGKMWYDLNNNGTCILTIVSSLPDGSSRYVQMNGERGLNPQDPMRLEPADEDGPNYMIVTELPPDTVLLSEVDRFTGKLVSTASLSLYKNEIIQVSHEIGNSTRLDGHQIARLTRTKDRSSSSRGTMQYLLNGDLDLPSTVGGGSLVDLFPVLNQIDGVNWQGFCRVVNDNMVEQRSQALLSGGMRYDLHQNGTCTMTSLLMHPDGRTHQIQLQGRRVGKSKKRSIRLDPISEESPFYTVLTEVPPDTILLNEVDKATNKVIFTASVSIENMDELVQISHEVDSFGKAEEGHKVWRLRRSHTLGKLEGRRNSGAQPYGFGNQGRPRGDSSGSEFMGQGPGFNGNNRGQGFRRESGFREPGYGPRGGVSNQASKSDREKFYSDQGDGSAAAFGTSDSYGGFRDTASKRSGDRYSSHPPKSSVSFGSPSFGTADTPFGSKKPKDPNLMFDFE